MSAIGPRTMASALKDVPESFMPQPDGLVAMEVEGTGKGPRKEFFYQENVPREPAGESAPATPGGSPGEAPAKPAPSFPG